MLVCAEEHVRAKQGHASSKAMPQRHAPDSLPLPPEMSLPLALWCSCCDLSASSRRRMAEVTCRQGRRQGQGQARAGQEEGMRAMGY